MRSPSWVFLSTWKLPGVLFTGPTVCHNFESQKTPTSKRSLLSPGLEEIFLFQNHSKPAKPAKTLDRWIYINCHLSYPRVFQKKTHPMRPSLFFHTGRTQKKRRRFSGWDCCHCHQSIHPTWSSPAPTFNCFDGNDPLGKCLKNVPTGWKINGWKQKINGKSPVWKGKSSESNLQFWGFVC